MRDAWPAGVQDPGAGGAGEGVERGEIRSAIADQEPGASELLAEAEVGFRACTVRLPEGLAVTPPRCIWLAPCTMNPRTRNLFSSTVSTCKNSTARFPAAWACGNYRQAGLRAIPVCFMTSLVAAQRSQPVLCRRRLLTRPEASGVGLARPAGTPMTPPAGSAAARSRWAYTSTARPIPDESPDSTRCRTAISSNPAAADVEGGYPRLRGARRSSGLAARPAPASQRRNCRGFWPCSGFISVESGHIYLGGGISSCPRFPPK